MAKKLIARRKPTARGRSSASTEARPSCGLCGKTKNLTRTECCGEWICDDQNSYVLFSSGRNSCHRNHAGFTLCALHCTEKHRGEWQACKKCPKGLATEMYVWYGTNEYNFEKLENPPAFEPTKCSHCDDVINLGTDRYNHFSNLYICMKCAAIPPAPVI
jgi:hypothetical protein